MTAGRLFTALCCAALAGPWVSAQSNSDEEVVNLSPFVVEESARGYRASNTISATKVNTSLRDLPLSLEVITEDFMNDIAAFDVQEALRYTAGVVPSGDAGSRIRGFSGNWSQRNGFRRYDIGDAANVQRVEVIKGPSGVLYGLTRPGGVVNYITKRPVIGVNFAEIKLTYGSENFKRGVFDANVAVADNLAFRLIGSETDTETAIINGGYQLSFLSPSIVYRFSENTMVTFEAEFLDRDRVPHVGRVNNVGGWFRDNLGDGSQVYVDELFPYISRDQRFAHPDENQSNEVDTFILTLDHRFSENLSARLVGYKMNRTDREISTSRRGWNTGITAARDANNDFILDASGGRVPYLARLWSDDRSMNDWEAVQLDVVYNFETKGMRHQLLGGYYWREDDHNRTLYEDRDFIRIADPANPGATPAGYTLTYERDTNTPLGFLGPVQRHFVPLADVNDQTLAIYNPDNAFPNWQFPWLSYNDIIAGTAYYLTYLGKAFEDKLIIMAGIRYEEAEKTRYSWGAVGAEAPWDDDHLAPQVGLIYNFMPEVGVYAIYAESFDPQNGQSNSFGEQFDPLVGENLEFGIKGDLNEGRYSYTFAYFDVDETNRIYNDPNAINAGGGLGDNVAAGLVNSTGFDFTFTANPVPNWSTVIGVSYIDLEEKDPNPGKLDNFEGTGLTWSLWTNYVFTEGGVEGLSIGGGIIYTDEWDAFGGRVFGDYYMVDARVGYVMQLNEQVDAEFALNVKNVTDERDKGNGGGWLAPRQYYLSATLRF
jgi:iron complex outermembrane receptor protein